MRGEIWKSKRLNMAAILKARGANMTQYGGGLSEPRAVSIQTGPGCSFFRKCDNSGAYIDISLSAILYPELLIIWDRLGLWLIKP